MPSAHWKVVTLPRSDGINFDLRLSTPTTDPRTVAAIEDAAMRAGMVLIREEDTDE